MEVWSSEKKATEHSHTRSLPHTHSTTGTTSDLNPQNAVKKAKRSIHSTAALMEGTHFRAVN